MVPDSTTDPHIELPSDVADHLATVGNLNQVPETLDEYWAAFGRQLDASDRTIGPADLYTSEPTRHEVRVDDHIRYSPCVVDALMAAVLASHRPATVRSVDPVTGAPVTFSLGDESVGVSPDGAVVSFGTASAIPSLESTDETVFSWLLRAETPRIRNAFCRHINAFESVDTYNRWTASSDDVSIPIDPGAVAALIRQFVDRS